MAPGRALMAAATRNAGAGAMTQMTWRSTRVERHPSGKKLVSERGRTEDARHSITGSPVEAARPYCTAPETFASMMRSQSQPSSWRMSSVSAPNAGAGLSSGAAQSNSTGLETRGSVPASP